MTPSCFVLQHMVMLTFLCVAIITIIIIISSDISSLLWSKTVTREPFISQVIVQISTSSLTSMLSCVIMEAGYCALASRQVLELRRRLITGVRKKEPQTSELT